MIAESTVEELRGESELRAARVAVRRRPRDARRPGLRAGRPRRRRRAAAPRRRAPHRRRTRALVLAGVEVREVRRVDRQLEDVFFEITDERTRPRRPVMSEVIDVTRAELFKLVRRPAAWTLLAAAAVLSQVFGYLIPYLSYAGGTRARWRAPRAKHPGQHAAGPARRQHARRVPGVRRGTRPRVRRAGLRQRVRLGDGQDPADPAPGPGRRPRRPVRGHGRRGRRGRARAVRSRRRQLHGDRPQRGRVAGLAEPRPACSRATARASRSC